MYLKSGSRKRKIRCKSGSEWDSHDLDFFRVRTTYVRDFEDFFGESIDIPITNSDVREFLSYNISQVNFQQHIEWDKIGSKIVKRVIKDLVSVTKTHRSEESAVDDLAKSILQMFDYDYGDRTIRTRETIDLDMANGKTQANPDICVEDTKLSIKLLVQEDKSYNVGNDKRVLGHSPEAQLVAEAIAAFQDNVRVCDRLGITELSNNKVIPGIVLLGTCPTFYLIPVNTELSDNVKQGTEPSKDTVVKKYIIPNLPVNMSDAMLSSDNALHIAKCFECFRNYV